jgi:hypothetical protein
MACTEYVALLDPNHTTPLKMSVSELGQHGLAPLNLGLYRQLLSCLDADNDLLSRDDLVRDGLGLLHALHQNHPHIDGHFLTQSHALSFLQMKRLTHESIGTYYSRFTQASKLFDGSSGVHFKDDFLRLHFLFSLGDHFDFIISDYKHLKLDTTWTTLSWPELLIQLQRILSSEQVQDKPNRPQPTQTAPVFDDILKQFQG